MKFASLSLTLTPINSIFKKHTSTAIFLSPKLSLSSRVFSSSPPSHPKPSSLEPPEDSSFPDDDIPADVTTEELKQRIEKYLGGDSESLPSIFEAILARKLSGKHDDTDDELMEEFRSKTLQDEDQQSESDDDDEDFTDSDEEQSPEKKVVTRKGSSRRFP